MASKNNNTRGIILILLAMIVFSVQDGIMKHIFNFVSLYEIYLIRTVVSFALIVIFLKITKRQIKKISVFWIHNEFFLMFSSFVFCKENKNPKKVITKSQSKIEPS